MKDELTRPIGYAILAPSGHNAQTWKFKVEEDSYATVLFIR